MIREKMHHPRRGRRGAALVYVVIIMTVMMGLTSLAVDLGRYEMAHSSLYNAACGAARAGALEMSKTTGTASSVTAAATAAAVANSADGQAITSSMVTVQYIKWSTSSRTGTVESTSNFSKANAVRVTVTYTCPLPFGQVLGLSSKKAVESSTAMVTVQSDTPTVYATGNPWLAGQTTVGTKGSQPDPGWSSSSPNSDHLYKNDIANPNKVGQNTAGNVSTSSNYSSAQPYSSPIEIAFTVTPGSIITITNASGSVSWDHNTTANTDPTANTGTTGNYSNAAANGISEHGIADVTMPIGAMNAVFLGSGLPDNISTPPTPLDFSTQAERDYVGLQPLLQQPFYVGDGQTSSGVQQSILVPAGATRLYMGIMDGWEWSNNNGSFGCTVTQVTITTVQ